jgi:protein-disulfide isomerase
MGRNRSKKSRRRSRSSSSALYIWGAVIAVALVVGVIVVAVVSSSGDSSPPEEIVVPTPRPAGIVQGGHVFGDPNAPVLVKEYLDYQCPFCRRAQTEILPAIEQQYIESGEARLEVFPIAILGDDSVQAGAAAECANEQGQFLAFLDVIFANQGGENSGAYSDDRLKQMASALGLDTSDFNSCLDSGRHQQTMVQFTNDANSIGVASTPTFFVNDQRVETGIDTISSAIEQALEN